MNSLLTIMFTKGSGGRGVQEIFRGYFPFALFQVFIKQSQLNFDWVSMMKDVRKGMKTFEKFNLKF